MDDARRLMLHIMEIYLCWKFLRPPLNPHTNRPEQHIQNTTATHSCWHMRVKDVLQARWEKTNVSSKRYTCNWYCLHRVKFLVEHPLDIDLSSFFHQAFPSKSLISMLQVYYLRKYVQWCWFLACAVCAGAQDSIFGGGREGGVRSEMTCNHWHL